MRVGGYYSGFSPAAVTFSISRFISSFSCPVKQNDGITLLAVNSNLHDSNGKTGDKTWLLEVPHPVTQIAWDSWIEIHPETAKKFGIKHGDLVEISSQSGRNLQVAAWLFYGIDKNTVAMPTGMGRSVLFPGYKSSRGRNRLFPILESKKDRVLKSITVGVNVMDLLPFQKDALSAEMLYQTSPVKIKPTGRRAYLVSMDGQYMKDIKSRASSSSAGSGDRSQKGRGFIRTVSIESLNRTAGKENLVDGLKTRHYTINRPDRNNMYDPPAEELEYYNKLNGKDSDSFNKTPKWEIVIDLDRCTGCSSCVIACYAENNIPVVGKDRMFAGREMSWIRVERYFELNPKTGQSETYYSPQMCAQCDNAGCEAVCPVYATYQTSDGLNAMIYNRCVGTRYCSNNCVFKQRRFNWRTYEFPSPLHMQLNPAVTVREKGVMEKCTFCQHRIREIKSGVGNNNRNPGDNEIRTACQQACPSKAITFGDSHDKTSGVSRLKTETKRNYVQLEELNYKPAITYLKKVNHNNGKA